MNIFRKALRKLIHILGENRIITPMSTMTLLHAAELGRLPDLKNPKDFNEKIIWMEFNVDTSMWSQLADKYNVRNYVAEKGLRNILIPDIGVYVNPEDIDFESLPQSFVIKSTNGCGQIIIVNDKDKLNISETIDEIKNWKRKKFGYSSGEKHYLSIPFRIMIESLLPLKNQNLPIDYKFYCFNGEVKYCLVVSERIIKGGTYLLNLFSLPEWEEINDAIYPEYKGNGKTILKPLILDEMIKTASVLSRGFPFVRVDLYEVNGKIYFGEMTFTPAGGRKPYMPKEFLLKLGELIQI